MSNTEKSTVPPIPTRYRQGFGEGSRIQLYACSGTALRDFAQKLRIAFFRFGLTARADVRQRYLELSQRRYGATCAVDDDRAMMLFDHPRGSEIFGTALPDPSNDPALTALVAELPNAEFSNGVVSFQLPAGVDLSTLESKFHALLLPQNLLTYLETGEGQTRLVRAGYPARARLFTNHRTQGNQPVSVGHDTGAAQPPRRSVCQQFYMVRINQEAALVLRALVQAVRNKVAAANLLRMA